MKKLAIAIILVLAFSACLSVNGNGEHARVNGYQQGSSSTQYDASSQAADADVYGKTEGWPDVSN